MADVSKLTATKLANSSAIVSAIEVQGTRIAQRARAVLFGDAEDAPDLVGLVVQMGVRLKLAEDDLRSAEAEYLAERTDDAAVRATRDDAVGQTSKVYLGVQGVVRATFGDRHAARVGLGGPVERRPDLLAAQARNAQRLLTSVEPPDSQLGGATLDPAVLAAQIDAAVSPLEQAIRDLDREVRENQQAMIGRDQQAAKWETVYVAVANLLVALAVAAGEHALADRIRPTDRRRTGVEGPTDPGPSPDEPVEPTDG